MLDVNYKSKINPRNKMFADNIRDLSKIYSIIGVIDVEGLPAPQFQKIRSSISEKAKILIVKKKVVELMLKELEEKFEGISALISSLKGIVGLLFTNENPFTLYKFVKKSKSSAPIKAGQVAPKEIVVPAQETSFAPGPIIGELGALKIKAGISNGKVEIKEDSVVAKEGDVVSPNLAGILLRLGIEPMEVGLNIQAVYEEGVIYDSKVLDVDEKVILNDLKTQTLFCSKLALELGYITKENIGLMLGKVVRDSIGLGLGINYPATETIKKLLVKARSGVVGVAQKLPSNLKPAGLEVQQNVVTENKSVVAEESSASNEGKEKKEEEPVDAAAGLGSLF